MENTVTVNDTEKTWQISIGWQSGVDKETMDKITEVVKSVLDVWEFDRDKKVENPKQSL